MVRVAAVGVLPDKLDGDGPLHVVGNVEQLSTHNADIVLFETILGLGLCRLGGCGLGRPLDGHGLLCLPLLLLLGRRG